MFSYILKNVIEFWAQYIKYCTFGYSLYIYIFFFLFKLHFLYTFIFGLIIKSFECERVSGNINAFLLVSVRGAQFSLTVSLLRIRIVSQHMLPQGLSLSYGKFAFGNQIK